jgi:hypothetical protein
LYRIFAQDGKLSLGDLSTDVLNTLYRDGTYKGQNVEPELLARYRDFSNLYRDIFYDVNL